MKVLLIGFIFILASCSSTKKRDYLPKSDDALSNESLSRQEINLEKEAKSFSEGLLAKCYNDKQFNIRTSSRTKLDKLRNSFSYWSAIGSCYLHQGKQQKGLFFYKLSLGKIKNKTQKAIYFNNLGVFYTKVNRLNLAIDFFNQSIKENRNYRTPHMNLAMIYAQFDLNTKAKKHLSRFKNLQDPHVKYLSLIIDANMGKNNAAKKVAEAFPSYLTEEEKKESLKRVYKN